MYERGCYAVSVVIVGINIYRSRVRLSTVNQYDTTHSSMVDVL